MAFGEDKKFNEPLHKDDFKHTTRTSEICWPLTIDAVAPTTAALTSPRILLKMNLGGPISYLLNQKIWGEVQESVLISLLLLLSHFSRV